MKRTVRRLVLVLVAILVALASLPAAAQESEGKIYYVYKDFGSDENHFYEKAKMSGINDTLVFTMNEEWKEQPYSGDSCIRCQINTEPQDWGGWLFLNGYMAEGQTQPSLNDGTTPNQGADLSGAKELRFYARGQTGRERIEFFCCGYGYEGDKDKALVAFPDSALKQTKGYIDLTENWTEYVIPLDDSLDLSNISCGFGYVGSGGATETAANLFYLDEIRYVW